MDNFIKDVDHIVNDSLIDELSDLKKIGSTSKEPLHNQKVTNFTANSEEVIHIVPKNPLFNEGTLLGFSQEVDDDLGFSLKSSGVLAEDGFDGEVYLSQEKIRNAEDLGKTYISKATVMVTGESIEIKKSINSRCGYSRRKQTKKYNVTYHVQHYLHVINDREKILVPTSVFARDSSNEWASRRLLYVSEDQLDLREIISLYESADPAKVIRPFEILKET